MIRYGDERVGMARIPRLTTEALMIGRVHSRRRARRTRCDQSEAAGFSGLHLVAALGIEPAHGPWSGSFLTSGSCRRFELADFDRAPSVAPDCPEEGTVYQ